ncbi:phospholipase, patatin family protein, partial [Aspergillus saccharolyticus JOP 1030-1]
MQQVEPMYGGEPNPVDSTGLCLLSLDGGGVRGLSTLYILKGLMDRLNLKQADGSPPKKPCEVFDLIGGTSTGGLIAIMLGRLEMDVDECIAAYIQLMKKIFRKPARWNLAASIFGNIEPRFDASKLEEAINQVISSRGANPTDLFNNQTKRGCRVFVCSISQETKDIVRLRSYPVPGKPDIPATICQTARATSAATTFFDPVSIGARRFADGALGANNPVEEVEREASDIWCRETGDLKPLHYNSKRYFRFNVEQGLQEVGLAEYQNQGLIEAATQGYLDHQTVDFRVRDCIENL